MGSEWIRTTPEGAKLGLWRIEESAETLEASIPWHIRDKDPLLSHGTCSKRVQRAAVRALVQAMMPEALPILYTDRTPKLHDERYRISITHDAEFVAVHITNFERAAGVDLQKCRPAQLERVARRFLDRQELEAVENCAPSERSRMLNLIWCTKESLYKGIGNVPFRGSMQVASFRPSLSGRIIARVWPRTGSEKAVELHYQSFGEHHLVHIADEGAL